MLKDEPVALDSIEEMTACSIRKHLINLFRHDLNGKFDLLRFHYFSRRLVSTGNPSFIAHVMDVLMNPVLVAVIMLGSEP